MMLPMPTVRSLTGVLIALALGVASCGGDDGPRAPATPGEDTDRAQPAPERRAPAEPEADSEVDPDDVRVVRAWADALRRGDVRGAARFFALPSVVSNGTPPVKLESRAAVRIFNRLLPCGAKAIDSEPAAHGFFIVTFRLTERPGRGRCGSGTGETARTAFRVRDDHITEWLRVPDVESAPETLS
jgi:limonene-1,2-epoxide hydrolase